MAMVIATEPTHILARVSPPSSDEVRQVRELRARLDGLTIRDAARLGRRLKSLRDVSPDKLRRIADQVTAAEALVAARIAAVPAISYPDLPVAAHRDELARAITDNQVVVVAGATGSGKTTQLPKICLELGRGVRGTIGHTQPRRLAARTVAQRIADELGTPLGEAIGYTVRFTDQASDRTLVKLMTDGILLAEIQRDRRLLRYDTLILDEAHERSLNIDFLLGYLRELLPRRPDLKVIVTSATIEPERFAAHFGGAPIIEVSGRTYPVEIRYRPLEVVATADDSDDPDDPDHDIVRTEMRDQTEAIVDAIAELEAEPPGDVLVFLSGEREIRDTAEALRHLKNTEVLPLYARLPTAEQQRVFQPHVGRRVVLATNVAETSLTVPGVRYVVDPGTARISRYSRRTKVQRLPIEPISQASAAQRAGRSGRTAPGVCIRLYSEEDFESRPRYTDPEILRTNLAAVLLQMAALQLGDVEDFPFLDPPDRRSVRDGVQLLQELGAFDSAGAITDIGRRLAQLPIDPDSAGWCCRPMPKAVCVRCWCSRPRCRFPTRGSGRRAGGGRPAEARPLRRRAPDFTSYLNLWHYLRDQRKGLSGSAFRRMCREEFLHYLRIREWQDLTGQLRSIAAGLGLREGSESDESADPARVHAALAAGLLSHVGLREGSRATTPGRATRSSCWPRIRAHQTAAALGGGGRAGGDRPAVRTDRGADRTGGARTRCGTSGSTHLQRAALGRQARRGDGLRAGDALRAAAGAAPSRGLCAGRSGAGPRVVHPPRPGRRRWQTRHHFFRDNANLRTELAELEERARRRDLLVSDDEIYAFYAARIPEQVVSARHFDGWWKKQRHRTPDLLTLTRDDLLRVDESSAERPDSWNAGDLSLPLTYRFEPGAADDGVTVHVPVEVLARLGGEEFGWQVPALREELVTALIRSLPKDLRRNFVPAPDTARAVLAALAPGGEPLLEALQRELHRRTGILVPITAFDLDKLPVHLRVTFAVEAPDGTEIARGKDLEALQEQLAGRTRRAVADVVAGQVERTGLQTWPEDLDELPRTVERTVGSHAVRGYPGFVEAGAGADVRVFATAAERDAAMTAGLRRLLRRSVPSPVKAMEKVLDPRTRLVLGSNPDGSLAALLEDCADAAVDALVSAPVWTKADFAALRGKVEGALPGTARQVLGRVEKVLAVLA